MNPQTCRRFTVLVALASAFVSLPALGQPTTPCMSGGPIGDCPGWVDMDGNGRWNAGDQLISFVCSPGPPVSVQILNPWSTNCGDTSGNVVNFTSTDGATGCFNSAYRMKPGFEFQNMGVTNFTGGQPTAFSFFDARWSGNGSLVGTGGFYDSLSITGASLIGGGSLNLLVGPFQGTDASGAGGAFNHITVPWSIVSGLAMNGTCRLGAIDPQIFLPVVAVAGGYQLQFNFSCASSFCPSPPVTLVPWQPQVAGEVIPTLGEWGLILFLLGVAALGWWGLRRRQTLA